MDGDFPDGPVADSKLPMQRAPGLIPSQRTRSHMPATKTLMKKKHLDSVCGARSGGAGCASEARVSSVGVALCWVFGFWLTLRCWVKSQSSRSENLSLSLFFFFRICPCPCGLWSLVRQYETDLSSGCPPAPGRDVVGAPPSHRTVFVFHSQWIQRQHRWEDACLQACVCPGHVVSVVSGTFNSSQIFS